jgi:hypothetical protein
VDQPRAVALLLLAACDEEVDGGGGAALATEIVEAPGATGEGPRDAQRAVNGVRGAGQFAGNTNDVFSLGLEVGADDVIVLGFGNDAAAIDVEGPDLAIFENAFEVESGGYFLDPIVVEVSADCETFVAFPHVYEAPDPTVYEPDPALWIGFAGLGPVLLHEEDNPVDPLSEEAGGDRFDLADLDASDPVAADVLATGARCVRLRSAAVIVDPATGEPYPRDPISNGADIDGVYAHTVE